MNIPDPIILQQVLREEEIQTLAIADTKAEMLIQVQQAPPKAEELILHRIANQDLLQYITIIQVIIPAETAVIQVKEDQVQGVVVEIAAAVQHTVLRVQVHSPLIPDRQHPLPAVIHQVIAEDLQVHHLTAVQEVAGVIQPLVVHHQVTAPEEAVAAEVLRHQVQVLPVQVHQAAEEEIKIC